MDAFSGYNQIRMHEDDQEKTSFVTSQCLFCYKVMPFGLKNAGATYQRLMNKMFAQQIVRNVQVLRGRHASEKPKGGRSLGRPQRDIRHPLFLQYEAQPRKIRLQSDGGKIPRIHGVSKGHRS